MIKKSHFCPNCGQCHFEGEINGRECKIITSKNNGNYVVQIYDYFSAEIINEFMNKSLTRINQEVMKFNLIVSNPKLGCITC